MSFYSGQGATIPEGLIGLTSVPSDGETVAWDSSRGAFTNTTSVPLSGINVTLGMHAGGSGLSGNGSTAFPLTTSLPLTTKGDLLGYSTGIARVPAGIDGDALLADSTALKGVAYEAINPYYTTGSNPLGSGLNSVWYAPKSTASLGSTQVTTGTLFATPYVVKRRITVDALGFSCNVAGSATKVRCGIYRDLSQTQSPITTPNWPGDLVTNADSGDVTPTSSTFSFATLGSPVTLYPGLYWLAIQSDAADNTCLIFGSSSGGNDNNVLGFIPSISRNAGISGASTANVYGAMPSTWPAAYGTASVLNTGPNPYAFMHLSA